MAVKFPYNKEQDKWYADRNWKKTEWGYENKPEIP